MSFLTSLRRWFTPRNLSAPAPCARALGVMHRQLDAMYRTARRLGVSEADVEDVIQDVLLVVLRRLDDIEPDKERAFVVGVTARTAQTWHRRRRRHPEDAHEALDDLSAARASLSPWQQAPDPGTAGGERHVERAQQLELLEAALERMTEPQRVAFVAFELEELSARQVAEQLGVSEGTVVSRVRRAREVFWELQGQRLADEAAADEAFPSVRCRAGGRS